MINYLIALKLQPERFTQPLVIVGLCIVLMAILLAVFSEKLAQLIISRNDKTKKDNENNEVEKTENTDRQDRKTKLADYKMKIKYISLAIAFVGCIIAVLGAN